MDVSVGGGGGGREEKIKEALILLKTEILNEPKVSWIWNKLMQDELKQ